jgi:hypothetical protein
MEGSGMSMRIGLAAMFVVGLSAAPTFGQAGGVVLDGEKVLRWSETAKGKNAAKLNKLRANKNAKTEENSELAYVSLPALCKEAKKLIDAGQKLPPEMANLGGITQLQYVFVYPGRRPNQRRSQPCDRCEFRPSDVAAR